MVSDAVPKEDVDVKMLRSKILNLYLQKQYLGSINIWLVVLLSLLLLSLIL